MWREGGSSGHKGRQRTANPNTQHNVTSFTCIAHEINKENIPLHSTMTGFTHTVDKIKKRNYIFFYKQHNVVDFTHKQPTILKSPSIHLPLLSKLGKKH